MKTVVATYLVWLKDTLRQGPPYPPINLLLVGNEENGESEPMGTPHVLRLVGEEEHSPEGTPYAPRILIAGERTGERGNERWGEVCTQNRGVLRLEVVARGERGHTAISAPGELSERLVQARSAIADLFNRTLTLNGPAGWQSQVRFPFIQVGTPGVFNIAADLGVLGIEVRPIPEDDIDRALGDVEGYCAAQNLELRVLVKENGIACSPDNPYLQALVQAVEGCSGAPITVGKKLPGTSARFAPGGQGVVWGQSGLGPHARGERHYIPSILPYYLALQEYGRVLLAQGA
jgi:acetylornithine deacetylase/succinyl-diaminopimelate desuccinylase-like protein